ncbi:MAG: DUF2283 domain-containing protein [archaeon]|nr:DUF2283 domain-containing protein [archaeon]MCP8313890.1 DUF2283 domain-containing protein [archaeon]
MAEAVKVWDLAKLIPYMRSLTLKSMWVDYDEEADVLYVSFQKPQNADDSKMDGDVITHYKGKEVVGVRF